MREIAFGTFDNFNQVIAGVKGNLAQGIELFSEALTAGAMDEVSTEYGLLAEAVSYPDDYSSVTYRLRANARWHDGQPVTAEDVVYSFDVFKKNSPQLAAYYRHVDQGGKDRRRARSPLPSTAPAIANCRRSSANCRCCRSTGGKAPTSRAKSAT